MIDYAKNILKDSNLDITLLRISFIIIFGIFGYYKWFHFEAVAVDHLVANTWLGYLYRTLGLTYATYLLGIVENIALIFTIVGLFKPKHAIIGDLLIIITGLTTLSLLPQIGKIDGFILKDVFLVSGGLVLLKRDLES